MDNDIENVENLDAKIKFIDQNGNAIEHKILFTFDCEELEKHYIVFETDAIDDDGKTTIGVTAYDPDSEIVQIEPIEDPDELDMINDIVKEVLGSQGV